MSEFSDLVLKKKAMGWPTIDVLKTMTPAELSSIHDVFVTADIARAASPSWRESHSEEAGELQELLDTLSWPQQRDVAFVYVQEIYRRESMRREGRMERLTWIATTVGVAALLLSAIALIAQLGGHL